MSVTVAENAGFCFGVKRATDSLEKAIESRTEGERLYTLGHLIHNDIYNRMLSDRGVGVASIGEIEDIARGASETSPVTVFIRAHGIPKGDEAMLCSLAEENRYFRPTILPRYLCDGD